MTFGANSGGNIINLVQKMHPSWNNHQVLTYLEQQIKSHNLKYAEDYEADDQRTTKNKPLESKPDSRKDEGE